MIFYTAPYSSPVGPILLASDGDRLTGLWLTGQKYFAATATWGMLEKSDVPVLLAVRKWLDKYFNGQRPRIADLPLSPVSHTGRRAAKPLSHFIIEHGAQ